MFGVPHKGRWRAIGAAIALSILCLSAPGKAATTVEGVYALVGTPQQVAGELTATAAGSPTDVKLDVAFRRVAEKNPLRKYDVEMTQQMHVISVSDDFSVFLHRHVGHVIDGHGQLRVRFPKPGLYHIYVDAAPRTIGRQVMRFDVPIGDVPNDETRDLGNIAKDADVGPYTVRFDRLELTAGHPSMLPLHILQRDKPARDLHPYLGAAAHAVLISSEDLSYIHVHPVATSAAPMKMDHDDTDMSMPASAMDASPADMTLHVTVPKPGTYKLWLQFIGGRTVYTAPFVVIAK